VTKATENQITTLILTVEKHPAKWKLDGQLPHSTCKSTLTNLGAILQEEGPVLKTSVSPRMLNLNLGYLVPVGCYLIPQNCHRFFFFFFLSTMTVTLCFCSSFFSAEV
jgi:hypothetical protein